MEISYFRSGALVLSCEDGGMAFDLVFAEGAMDGDPALEMQRQILERILLFEKDAKRWRHCKAHGHPMTGTQCIAWTYDGRMVLGATPEEAVDNAMAYRIPDVGAA